MYKGNCEPASTHTTSPKLYLRYVNTAIALIPILLQTEESSGDQVMPYSAWLATVLDDRCQSQEQFAA